jgi:hypothetical protein
VLPAGLSNRQPFSASREEGRTHREERGRSSPRGTRRDFPVGSRWQRCRVRPFAVGTTSSTRNMAYSTAVAGQDAGVATYSLNERAVARARRLIEARQYVLESDWGSVQPRVEQQNAFLASHSWEEYAEWHLGSRPARGTGPRPGTRLCTGFPSPPSNGPDRMSLARRRMASRAVRARRSRPPSATRRDNA